jgi:hypothetical protein
MGADQIPGFVYRDFEFFKGSPHTGLSPNKSCNFKRSENYISHDSK